MIGVDQEAYAEGELIDSKEFDGIKLIVKAIKNYRIPEGNKLGSIKTAYRLRDWLISRQRYCCPYSIN